MTVSLDALQADLPNFPREVLEDWLLPFAQTEGWPPAVDSEGIPSDRWRPILNEQPLSHWRSVKWAKCEGLVSFQHLHLKTQIMVLAMERGLFGPNDAMSEKIKAWTLRFNRIVEYFAVHGVFPRPPVLLVEDGKLFALDGNHRIAAYLYCLGCFKVGRPQWLQVEPNPIQTYWIAEG